MSRNFTSVLFGLIGAAALSSVAVAAGPDLGPVQMQSLNWAAIGIFALFVLGTLGITYRAAMQTKTATARTSANSPKATSTARASPAASRIMAECRSRSGHGAKKEVEEESSIAIRPYFPSFLTRSLRR